MFAVILIGKLNITSRKRQKHNLIFHTLCNALAYWTEKFYFFTVDWGEREKKKKLHLNFERIKYAVVTIFFPFQGQLLCQTYCLTNKFLLFCLCSRSTQLIVLRWTIPTSYDEILWLFPPLLFLNTKCWTKNPESRSRKYGCEVIGL